MVSNSEVQERFEDFLEGDSVEWQLLKMFFHQNDGFSRVVEDEDGDVDSALGMTRSGGEIVISLMSLSKDDEGVLYAEEDEAVRLVVDDRVEARLEAMVKLASSYDAVKDGISFSDEEDESDGSADPGPNNMYA